MSDGRTDTQIIIDQNYQIIELLEKIAADRHEHFWLRDGFFLDNGTNVEVYCECGEKAAFPSGILARILEKQEAA